LEQNTSKKMLDAGAKPEHNNITNSRDGVV